LILLDPISQLAILYAIQPVRLYHTILMSILSSTATSN
jgi:hypothetical protein